MQSKIWSSVLVAQVMCDTMIHPSSLHDERFQLPVCWAPFCAWRLGLRDCGIAIGSFDLLAKEYMQFAYPIGQYSMAL